MMFLILVGVLVSLAIIHTSLYPIFTFPSPSQHTPFPQHNAVFSFNSLPPYSYISQSIFDTFGFYHPTSSTQSHNLITFNSTQNYLIVISVILIQNHNTTKNRVIDNYLMLLLIDLILIFAILGVGR